MKSKSLNPIDWVLRIGGACMLAGVVFGVLGLVLDPFALKVAAGAFLGLGVAIGFLPLVAWLGLITYETLRRILRSR